MLNYLKTVPIEGVVLVVYRPRLLGIAEIRLTCSLIGSTDRYHGDVVAPSAITAAGEIRVNVDVLDGVTFTTVGQAVGSRDRDEIVVRSCYVVDAVGSSDNVSGAH